VLDTTMRTIQVEDKQNKHICKGTAKLKNLKLVRRFTEQRIQLISIVWTVKKLANKKQN
jgi:hypothetical protein